MTTLNIFEHAIRSEEELREFVGTPHEAVVRKTISIIDDHCRRFIGMSPMMFLATCDTDGKCDVSPRGDEPGFVHIIDHKHLIIHEKPGNRRADSMLNIISNPQVGLLFLIPGMEEVLRVNGRACVVRTADAVANQQLDGKLPVISIAVEVEECFIHCPRALKKSHIWNVDSWPQSEELPSVMEMFRAHLQLNGLTLEE